TKRTLLWRRGRGDVDDGGTRVEPQWMRWLWSLMLGMESAMGGGGGCGVGTQGRGVVANGVVDRVDRVKGSVFGFGQKARRKGFPAMAVVVADGGGRWL
nr:hypothetical protein [Tanacetum cinerariifolium]